MKAIIGLGNPGPRYRYTRHNVGWHVLDRLAARWPGERPVAARRSEVLRRTVGGENVLLVKPQTMMNDSGKAVRLLIEKDGLGIEDLLVLYDDLDLALGRIRVRAGGSAGGHRGILSIQQELARVPRLKAQAAGDSSSVTGNPRPDTAGSARAVVNGQIRISEPPAFARIKIGLGRPPAGVDPIEFVLAPFSPDEQPLISQALDWAAEAAERWLTEGTEVTANRFNGKVPQSVAPAAPGPAATAPER